MTTKTARTWQEELAAECRTRGLTAPVWNIVSDRRGGRTAWSSTVTVNSQNIAARYWYDGQYLKNAKEDAGEVACTRLRSPSIPSMGGQGQGWTRSPFMNFNVASVGGGENEGAGIGMQLPELSSEEHLEGKIENWDGPSPGSVANAQAASHD